ncbi:MBL fold metallo-hydrolase [Salibacterium salarium]|uniref:MBL fold metallo-hydrolase n=1 Tax=Salibacterium salarium TaxID=284579 RepID=A0A3R9WTN7_9BACI|nr:helix-hairpin-helix domain-containing protein [Salibacterium salarium]RSL33350.1 MBL fold metallo-hydrolase [Salibacterium salarium]
MQSVCQKLFIVIIISFSGLTLHEVEALSSYDEVKSLDVHFLDVGQGDSTLIVSDDKETAILIDGGRPDEGEKIVQTLNQAGIDELEWVVATHPDIDHIGGLIDVLHDIDVENVLDSGRTHTTETYKKYREVLKEKNINFFVAEEGETLPTSIADVKILNGYSDSKIQNESSIALYVTYKNDSLLLTGDATAETEKDMMKEYSVKADVLKVAHHGSATSSSSPFVKAVSPDIAVLPFDKDNEFGHPNAEVVQRFRQSGAILYSTEQSDSIYVALTGVGPHVDSKAWEGEGKRYPKATPKIKPSSQKNDDIDNSIYVNGATAEELQQLPDIGPMVASFIVEYRTKHGKFKKAEELQEVNGIGRAAFEKIKPYIIL